MGNKDLTKEYAKKAYYEKLNKEHVIWRDKVFNACDISKAFSSGRESVLESLPELKWQRVHKDGPYLAVTVFNWFYNIEFAYNEFNLFCNSYYISCYLSLSEAKQAANEHYKKQIERALGL